MRTINSAFGKLLVSVMLVVGLTAASCNQRSGEVKVKRDSDGDVRIEERKNTDSLDYKHDKTIDRDDDGDVKVKENTKVDRDDDNTETRTERR